MSTHRPQDDFYHFVNQQWIDENPVPDTESWWGTFLVLRDQNAKRMQALYEDILGREPQTSIEAQAKDFYSSGINVDTYREQNMEVFRNLVEDVVAIDSTVALSRMIGKFHRLGIDAPWCVYIDSDEKDATKRVLRFHQAQLTLSGREYYLDDSDEMKAVRLAYEKFFDNITQQLLETHPIVEQLVFSDILAFESQLAKEQRTNVELRDIEKNYNPVSYDELQETYSEIHWDQYAQELHWQYTENINVDQPEVLAQINQLFAEYPLEKWKSYLVWLVIIKCAGYLSTETAQSAFALFGAALTGAKEMKSIERRTVMMMEKYMGENMGQLYVVKYFPASAKKKVEEMVAEVTKTYHDRIDRLSWMSDITKQKAHQKLDNMKVLIGYPDEWRSYEGLELSSQSILYNIIAAERFNNDYHMSRLAEPNNRDEWHMSPQTVNAYHDPNRLVICFPAGILQAPSFDVDASMPDNYGGIGTVIGHELTHGFDDQGSQFDAEGNVVQWQTDEERKEFMNRAQIISDQADQFEVVPGVYLKGKLVIGEAIADLGGIELAYETLQRVMGENFDENSKKSFFANFATNEVHNMRPEQKIQFALNDPHPDSVFRVNAMLEHVDAFHETYDVKEGDALYRPSDKRARIW